MLASCSFVLILWVKKKTYQHYRHYDFAWMWNVKGKQMICHNIQMFYIRPHLL